MSEIEKMYENAGIHTRKSCESCKRIKKGVAYTGDVVWYCDYQGKSIEKCPNGKDIYPPFTAEKQLKLICFFVNKTSVLSFCQYPFLPPLTTDKIAVLLAHRINLIWQDLTEEEKQQVKGILE